MAGLAPASDFGGVLAMLASCAVFVVGDTFMKLASAAVPPFEILALRGVFASFVCLALILWRGEARLIASAFEPRTLLRAGAETASVLCYIVALSRMPIADAIAILQTGPLIMILGAALVLREALGPARLGLALVGFAGAVMVAQPGASGFSSAAVYAFASACLGAARDLAGRAAPARVPVSVLTFATLILETAVAAPLSYALEPAMRPSALHMTYLVLVALLLVLGHLALLKAYRLGRTTTVAPFFYSFALFALLSGLIVWGQAPNALALAGIALIVASGVAILTIDQRRARKLAIARAL